VEDQPDRYIEYLTASAKAVGWLFWFAPVGLAGRFRRHGPLQLVEPVADRFGAYVPAVARRAFFLLSATPIKGCGALTTVFVSNPQLS